MSGDTTSSDMTWADAACSVDKLDKTAEDGAVNDRAAHEATSGRLLVDRTQFFAGPFLSVFDGPFLSAFLMKDRAALGGASALRGRHFERVVRSSERCSLYGGSTPR
jgi:hypothetical protein